MAILNIWESKKKKKQTNSVCVCLYPHADIIHKTKTMWMKEA